MGRGTSTINPAGVATRGRHPSAEAPIGGTPNPKFSPSKPAGPVTFTKIGVFDQYGNNARLISPATSLDIDVPSVEITKGVWAYPVVASGSTRAFDDALLARVLRHGFTTDLATTRKALWRQGIGTKSLGIKGRGGDHELSSAQLRTAIAERMQRWSMPIVRASLARDLKEVRKEVNTRTHHVAQLEETIAAVRGCETDDGCPRIPDEILTPVGFTEEEVSKLVAALRSNPDDRSNEERDEDKRNHKRRPRKGLKAPEIARLLADTSDLRLLQLTARDCYPVREMVRNLRMQGLPIVESGYDGYWLADDVDEVHDWSMRMSERASMQRDRISSLELAGRRWYPETDAEQAESNRWKSTLRFTERTEAQMLRAQAKEDDRARKKLSAPIEKARRETLRKLEEMKPAFDAANYEVGYCGRGTEAEKKLVKEYREAYAFAHQGKKRKRAAEGEEVSPWRLPPLNSKKNSKPAEVVRPSAGTEAIPPPPW